MAELVLKTEIDIKKAEKDLEKLKKELQQYDNEAKQLTKQKAEITTGESFKQYRQELTKLKEEYQKAMQSPLYGVDPTYTAVTDNIQKDIDLINEKYKETIQPLNEINTKLKDINKVQENTKGSIDNYKNAIDQAKQEIEDAKNKSQGIGEGFDKVIPSLKRFALSLFGIRSMFNLIRRGVSFYLSEHEETANKINAIWVALGNALGPIIEIIANMVLKLIGYLNVFLQALGFDVDLTKGMNKSKKAIEGTTGAMKELNNQVASFDEMNVAQKETSSGGIGGSGADGTSGFEMPELNSKVVKLLKDLGKEIKDNIWLIGALAGAFAAFKVADFLGKLGSVIGKASGAAGTGLLGLHNILAGLLAMEVITLTIFVVWSVKQFGDLNKRNEEITNDYKENTKVAKDVKKENYELAKSYGEGSQQMQDYINSINNDIYASMNDIQVHKNRKDQITLLDGALDGLSGTEKKHNEIVANARQRLIDNVSALQQVQKEVGLTKEQTAVYNMAMGELNDAYDEVNNEMGLFGEGQEFVEGSLGDTNKKLLEQMSQIRATDTEMKIATGNEKNYWKDLTNTIFGEIQKVDGASATVTINANTTPIESAFHKIANTPGITDFISSNIINILRFIKFARGGIVYNPGRGVPIAGEATGGPEGVVPLNNEQSMDLIGQSIARHLVVNLTNTTMLDNKVIAREQKKIETENNFATNGRGV